MNSPRKNDTESQVEFTLKVMKRARVSCIDVTVKKDSLLVYVLKFFRIVAGRCGSVVVREREIRIRIVLVRGPGSTLGWDFLSY